jgi:hypothetical protein
LTNLNEGVGWREILMQVVAGMEESGLILFEFDEDEDDGDLLWW